MLPNELTNMVFTIDGFFEAVIESWPEWDLNPQPLNPCSYAVTSWAIRPCVQLSLRVNFLQPLQFYHLLSVIFHFGRLPLSFATFHQSKFSVSIHTSVAEWTDQINIHHWRILGTSFRTLTWVALETATSEPFSDTLTNWTIRPYVQFALRANFVLPIQFHYLFSVKFHFGRWLPSVATFI